MSERTSRFADPIPAFDALEAPVGGATLIEASAGSGKTYGLVSLYLRLVVEFGYTVDQILTVTFTEAAASELRERTAERLARSLERIDHPDDPLLSALIDRAGRDVAKRRLEEATVSGDLAAIHTIHGFCARLLRDHAFETGSPFEFEVATNDQEYLEEAVEDFWRVATYDCSPFFADYLRSEKIGPATFLGVLKSRRPGVEPIFEAPSPRPFASFEASEQSYVAAFHKAKRVFEEKSEEIADILLNDEGLNRQSFKKSSITKWLAKFRSDFTAERPPVALEEYYKRVGRSKIEEKTKKNFTPPRHEFFDVCDDLVRENEALVEASKRELVELERRCFFETYDAAMEKRRSAGVRSFDDMIEETTRALRSASAPALIERLRERYRVALVDEFQDTDPAQYEIFRAIFDERAPVYFVGDPKQAIYSFRGADVFAYRLASERAASRLSLPYNYRSHPRLIRAVNELFRPSDLSADSNDAPFLMEWIPFRPAASPPGREPPPPLVIEGETAPMRIHEISKTDPKRHTLGKEEARLRSVKATADDIVRVLTLARSGRATIGDEPIRENDVAVLTRTNREAEMIVNELRRRGVNAASGKSGDLFDSAEARDAEYALAAMADPRDVSKVKTALATETFGYGAATLDATVEDDARWDEVLDGFERRRLLWRRRGALAAYRDLLADGVLERAAKRDDGERVVANLTHLGDALHQAEAETRAGPERLVEWFRERLDKNRRREERQLRLESDESAVAVVTVHRSKGLEYPIVYCPFFWAGRSERTSGTNLVYHDPERDYAAVVMSRFAATEDRSHDIAADEEIAELLRLFYVAATRAKYRCTFVWGVVSSGQTSPQMFSFREARPMMWRDVAKEKWKDIIGEELPSDRIVARLEELARLSDGTIEVERFDIAAPNVRYKRERSDDRKEPRARVMPRPVDRDFRVASFTSLSRQGRRRVETPDPDDVADYDELVAERKEAEDPLAELRGAEFGSLIHETFERIDFTLADEEEARRVVERTARKFGVGAEYVEPIYRVVENTLRKELRAEGVSFRLADAPAERRVPELDFYFPLKRVDPEQLREAFRGEGNLFDSPAASIESLEFAPTKGFMKGSIDLFFEAGGKYWIVDWKTNRLGAAPERYDERATTREMRDRRYALQYHLYALATHLHLKERLPSYDYEADFGGAFYLFVRGIRADRDDALGVFFDRPSAALMARLEETLVEAPTKSEG
ncbi:MAG: exodeoxyribonuclease V subunit beta [Ignavibacteriales bacterium]|nr:exodeoxyribonuclease V subunit beta [Ignavibacteriales bacterium]